MNTSEHEWNTSEHEWNTSEHEWNTSEHEWNTCVHSCSDSCGVLDQIVANTLVVTNEFSDIIVKCHELCAGYLLCNKISVILY